MNNSSARQLGWDEDMSQSKRREVVLSKCRNSPLKAARVMQQTAKRGKSESCRRKASSDANYFYRLYERRRGK